MNYFKIIINKFIEFNSKALAYKLKYYKIRL